MKLSKVGKTTFVQIAIFICYTVDVALSTDGLISYLRDNTISLPMATCIVISIICLVGLSLFMVYDLARQVALFMFYHDIAEQSEKLYLHGFTLERYLFSNTFLRLEKWLGYAMCHELSPIAMIMLKNYKSARLCRGEYHLADGETLLHSWVEVKVPLNGWYVFDFAWYYPAISRKKDMEKAHRLEKTEVEVIWSCSYKDFWSIKYSKSARNAMLKQDSSYILLSLMAYAPTEGERAGFTKCIYEHDQLLQTNLSYMPAYYHKGDPKNKPMSTEILHDFLKNPNRRQPRAKTIRLTKKYASPTSMIKAFV